MKIGPLYIEFFWDSLWFSFLQRRIWRLFKKDNCPCLNSKRGLTVEEITRILNDNIEKCVAAREAWMNNQLWNDGGSGLWDVDRNRNQDQGKS